MRRRYLGPLAASAAFLMTLALSACGEDSGVGQGDVTIKLVAADYGDREGNSSKRYWDQLAGQFEFRNPGIRVDVDVYGLSDIDRKVASLVADGKAPDLAQTGSYAGYAAQGKLYSAEELLSIPTQAAFLPGLADAGTVGRVQYGLPFVASTRVLFYNKKLFEDAGIEEPPETWSELQADAIALKQSGVKTPYALPLGPEEPQAETLNWMLSAGGGYTDNINAYTIDSPENIEAFEWLRDEMVAKGLTNPDPATTDRQDAFDAFTRGDVAMLNGHPTLMQLCNENGIEYGTAPIPGKTGKSKATTGVSDWMMAFKQRGHGEEAGKFLDFAYSKKNVLKFADQYDLLPVTYAASEAMREDSAHKEVWSFLEQLPTAQFYPVGKRSWGTTVNDIKGSIGRTVRKNGDPAGVLSALQRDAEAAERSSS